MQYPFHSLGPINYLCPAYDLCTEVGQSKRDAEIVKAGGVWVELFYVFKILHYPINSVYVSGTLHI